MTFKQLDEIARPKRYRGINANNDMLESDLLAARLENSSVKGAALIDTDANHLLQIAFEFLPNRAIIWFELNAYSEKKPLLPAKIKEAKNENTGIGKHRDENQTGSAGTNMLSNLFGPSLSAVLGLPVPQPLTTKPISTDPRPIGAVPRTPRSDPRSTYKNGSSKNISSTSTVGMKQTKGIFSQSFCSLIARNIFDT